MVGFVCRFSTWVPAIAGRVEGAPALLLVNRPFVVLGGADVWLFVVLDGADVPPQ